MASSPPQAQLGASGKHQIVPNRQRDERLHEGAGHSSPSRRLSSALGSSAIAGASPITALLALKTTPWAFQYTDLTDLKQ